MFAGINVLLALFVFFIVPETRQIKLEEMDTLFGGANHIEKGANLMGYASRDASVAAQGGRQGDEVTEIREAGQHDNKTAVHQIESVKSPN